MRTWLTVGAWLVWTVAGFAQEPPAQEPPKPETPPAAAAEAAQGQAALDLTRAMLPAFPGKVAFELEMTYKAGEKGATVRSAGTVASAPGHRFRAEVSITPLLGPPIKRYRVVSDGKLVTIQDLGAGVWSRQPWKAFDKEGNDFLVLGLFTGLAQAMLSELPPNLTAALRANSIPEPTRKLMVEEIGKEMKASVSQTTETQEGVERLVFTLARKPDEPAVKVFVDPATHQVVRISLAGMSGQANIAIHETIKSVAPFPVRAGSFLLKPTGKRVPRIALGGMD